MSRAFHKSAETTAGILFGAVMATLAVALFLLAVALGLLALVVVVVWFLGSLAIEALLDCVRRMAAASGVEALEGSAQAARPAVGEDIKWPRR
jgi:cobalamin biosynthesis protein CobD/CbiB